MSDFVGGLLLDGWVTFASCCRLLHKLIMLSEGLRLLSAWRAIHVLELVRLQVLLLCAVRRCTRWVIHRKS